MKKTAKHKSMLANGRSSKPVPNHEKWFAPIKPLVDIVHPAWRSLPKSATDVLIICKAKSGSSAAIGKKGKNGHPSFNFTFSEAETTFQFSRQTFNEAIKRLIQTGFLVQISSGGIHDGKGEAAEYQLTEVWKEYIPPLRSNANIEKARAEKEKKR